MRGTEETAQSKGTPFLPAGGLGQAANIPEPEGRNCHTPLKGYVLDSGVAPLQIEVPASRRRANALVCVWPVGRSARTTQPQSREGLFCMALSAKSAAERPVWHDAAPSRVFVMLSLIHISEP